ncbi:GIY-YIG nuclease family protein [Nocardiopsis synnemataformans]|uniref:GIY-YIG nuclease family protein n=1 Tax=Nocardiopsis synnemataformans TaxID=61305 RepID=UPI003EB75C98
MPSRAHLPHHLRASRRTTPGFLYVARLSTGDIKIGRAKNPETRLQQHAANAAMFRVTLLDAWISAQVEDSVDAETELIHRIELRGARALPRTRETFEGIDYETARAMAELAVSETLTRTHKELEGSR